MRKFIELTLIPNPETNLCFIWSKLYTQLHLAFVEIQDANKQVPVGVSFPEYKIAENERKKFAILGSKLRLFAHDEKTLVRLNLNKWLERLSDYIHIKNIAAVIPEKIKGYSIFSRYRFPASPEQLAKRFSRRHNISYQEALARLKEYRRETPVYPYIQLNSLSKKEPFNLFISQQIVDGEKNGAFSTYGLSSETTVPYW